MVCSLQSIFHAVVPDREGAAVPHAVPPAPRSGSVCARGEHGREDSLPARLALLGVRDVARPVPRGIEQGVYPPHPEVLDLAVPRGLEDELHLQGSRQERGKPRGVAAPVVGITAARPTIVELVDRAHNLVLGAYLPRNERCESCCGTLQWPITSVGQGDSALHGQPAAVRHGGRLEWCGVGAPNERDEHREGGQGGRCVRHREERCDVDVG